MAVTDSTKMRRVLFCLTMYRTAPLNFARAIVHLDRISYPHRRVSTAIWRPDKLHHYAWTVVMLIWTASTMQRRSCGGVACGSVMDRRVERYIARSFSGNEPISIIRRTLLVYVFNQVDRLSMSLRYGSVSFLEIASFSHKPAASCFTSHIAKDRKLKRNIGELLRVSLAESVVTLCR